jgi:dinuclear metal center YbgI/SA1388 family protein
MKCKEVFNKIEDWAPQGIAWDRDNAGLQAGSVEREVNKILLSLDLTEPVIKTALQENCNLIITHHPLIFQPLKKLDIDRDNKSRLLEKIIKNDITVYSAHTNLDYTKNGVSFVLAERLKLRDIRFLSPLKSNQSKIIVFVPSDAIGKVADAVFSNGGGVIGDYTMCSYRTEGKGTFFGSENTDPVTGDKENFEIVEEVRLEIVAENWKLKKIIPEMIKAHPYEEPAFDIYPLNNNNINYGAGAVGNLEKSMSADDFLNHTTKCLGIKNFRYSGKGIRSVKKVAVCGGSGGEYINDAVSSGADAYITGDIKYHSFQETEEKILLVDAGHYETEIFALDAVAGYLKKNFENIEIIQYPGNLNPINFYK